MASANLPSPTLTAAERDDIVTKMGGTDAYLAWLTSALAGELERRAATAAREAVNEQIRDAVNHAKAELPTALQPEALAASATPDLAEAAAKR